MQGVVKIKEDSAPTRRGSVIQAIKSTPTHQLLKRKWNVNGKNKNTECLPSTSLRLRQVRSNTYRPLRKNLGRKSERLGALDSFRAGEQAAVDSIDDGLGSNLSTAEEPSVQTLDGILATLNTVEFQIDVALRVRI